MSRSAEQARLKMRAVKAHRSMRQALKRGKRKPAEKAYNMRSEMAHNMSRSKCGTTKAHSASMYKKAYNVRSEKRRTMRRKASYVAKELFYDFPNRTNDTN